MNLIRHLLTLGLLLTASLCAAPQLWIKQHPDPHTLLAKTYSETQPAGYTAATEAEAAAWIAAELAAGWQPAPQPEPEPSAAYTGPTWTDAGEGHTGLTLAVDADSQAKFTADVGGYSARALAGDLDLDTETTVIRDAAGAEHTLTIRAYLRLIGRLHTALRAAWQSAD